MVALRKGGGLLALAALALSFLSSPCQAGAWLQETDRGQIIFASTSMQASSRFDRKGKPVQAGRFSQQDLAVTAEMGWSDSLTLIVGGQFQHKAFLQGGETQHSGILAATAGAKVRLWRNDQTVLSLQGTLQGAGERSLPDGLRRMGAPMEGDLRVNLGHNLTIAGLPAFVDLQAGYRWRGGGLTDEVRFDATLGLRPAPRWLVLLQSFNTLAIAPDRRFNGGRLRQHKVQPSLVYDLSETWSVQIGLFVAIRGQESLGEKGASVALWRKF
jgi:protein XagA